MTITAHAKATNSCVTDNIEPTVTIKLLDENGNRVADQLTLTIPTTPARGFQPPTQREASANLTINTTTAIGNVEFGYVNRGHGSWFISLLTSPMFWEIVGEAVSFFFA